MKRYDAICRLAATLYLSTMAGILNHAIAKQTLTDCDKFAVSSDTYEGYRLLSESGFDTLNGKGGISYDKLNPQRAIPACQQAVAQDPKNGRVWFQLGRALEKGNQVSNAISAYETAAQLGSADGLNNLGELYRAGKGVSRDVTKAEALFRQAAQAGSIEATVNLINLVVKRPDARAYYDELLTFSASNSPTDVSISRSILEALTKAELQIPAAVRNAPDGPNTFFANVTMTINPNTSDGSSYCKATPEGELCASIDRLNFNSIRTQLSHSTPENLSETSADIEPNISLSAIHIPRDITSVSFIYQLNITFNNITDIKSNRSSKPTPLTVEGKYLRRDSANCWTDTIVRICLVKS